MQKFFLIVNSARYLKFKQIFYRIFYRFYFFRPVRFYLMSVRASGSIIFPSWKNSSTVDGRNFSFLNIVGEIKSVEDWNSKDFDKLWLYNLHYLDSLNALDSNFHVNKYLLNRWIAENISFSGNGWEPYPLSLRIVNMVKFFFRQEVLESHWLESLAAQMEALFKQVEYHILGNHIFANGKALVFGGAYLVGKEADRWLERGLKILDYEVKEQFLEDGAHFELSPMYHAIMLWDMCDLVNLAEQTDLPELKKRLPKWRLVVRRGMVWFGSMQHPDGKIPFFNDSTFGVAPIFSDLEAYSSRLNGCMPDSDEGRCQQFFATHNLHSGYATINLGEGHKALLDLAKVGPDYQPGHAHADTLSFELSLFKQRIFVNCGISQYGEDSERHRQRSTAAHNTVEVAGENSSEVWAGFRVARRAFPVLEAFASDVEQIFIRAYHTGYYRLKGKNLHRREWLFSPVNCQIIDEVTGAYVNAVARLHVHPDVFFEWSNGALVALLENGQQVRVMIEGASSVTLQLSSWHPGFGSIISCQCIVAEFSSDKLKTHISWSDSF